MSDLISRKAAIDELVKMLGYCFQADEEVIDAVVTTINELPPAQLSTNLAEVGTDCISRQAAIDALRVAYWDDNIQSAKDDPCIVDAMTDWAIRQVKALPPAQPESLVNESRPLVKDLVKDTISRQAAIDALERDIKFVEEEREKAITRPEKYHDRFVEASTQQIMGMAHALQAIEELPSIRQKRTCVNCGRTMNNGGWYADGRTRCPIEEHYALPKDGHCHLWEKRNVTDDDYPERREE